MYVRVCTSELAETIKHLLWQVCEIFYLPYERAFADDKCNSCNSKLLAHISLQIDLSLSWTYHVRTVISESAWVQSGELR